MSSPPKIDFKAGVPIGIDWPHHEIHEGHAFTAHYESDPTDSETIGEETAVGFITPAAAAGRIHMIVDAVADDESVFEIREDPTIVLDQGTALPLFCRDRAVSASTSGMLPNEAAPAGLPTLTSYDVAEAAAANLATATGNLLHSETLAIGAGPPFGATFNNASRGQREFILAPETEYVVILTCSTNNQTRHEITLNWYEHTDSQER
jgi:hypothetical protein